MSQPPADLRSLLARYGIRPDKRLGQNFLFERSALERIIKTAEIGANLAVLEVGPGLGNLTTLLAERARRVVAVELDQRLIRPLGQVTSAFDNVKLVQGDILGFDPVLLMHQDQDKKPDYIVVANIPYYITSALIRHLLECAAPPQRLVLTVQREVAERICTGPGDMSLLALSVQVYGTPEITAFIPPSAFYPPPKIESAILRVNRYAQPLLPSDMLDAFFRLAKAGFSQKRKTLRNALAGGMRWEKEQAGAFLQKAGIDPQRRAETLSLKEWHTLTETTGKRLDE
jgi:16S rRNA (adenine1518-N6/adenine1519-N6)-dimethyltransferase